MQALKLDVSFEGAGELKLAPMLYMASRQPCPQAAVLLLLCPAGLERK